MIHNKKLRFTWLDVVLIVGLALFGWYTTERALQAIDYQWDWGFIPQYFLRYDEEQGRWISNLLLQGVLTTIKLSVWSALLSIILGTGMGLLLSGKRLFNQLVGRTYVELLRNTPPLVLAFIFFFFIGDQVLTFLGADVWIRSASPGVQHFMSIIAAPPELFTAFCSGVLMLALYEGAYITEIVRSGIQSVERGQSEAAYALGLSSIHKMRYVILPQAFRRILPPLTGQFISTVKDSSIVAVISIPEITFQGMELMGATWKTFEIWFTIIALYLMLTLPLSLFSRRLEAKFGKVH